MKIFTTYWNESGKAGQRSFPTLAGAKDFAQTKARAEDSSPASVWEFTSDGNAAEALAAAHDKAAWWDRKRYRGTALKNGSWTTR